MAKKALLRDHDNIEILPITRGELILDSSGKVALHSKEFLASNSQPGLMSAEDKAALTSLANGTIDSNLSTTSTNPVQNKVVTNAINSIKTSYLKSTTVSNNTLTIVDQSDKKTQFYNTTYGVVTQTADGLAPKLGTDASATIGTQADEWVLTSTKGGTPTWRKLPVNAFKDNNTTYTFASGNGGFTVTPFGGTVQTVSIGKPSTAGTSDKLVCEAASTNSFRHVWFSYDGEDGRLVYDDDFTYNPATNVLKVGSITGRAGSVAWEDITDKPSSFTPSAHNHTTAQITSLANYTKATSASDLITSDTLNSALGKLEYKADLGKTAYDIVNAAYDSDGTIENLTEILRVLEGIKDTETIKAIVGKYLPLSGGELTGNLTINADTNVGLNIKRTTTFPCIGIYGGSTPTIYGYYGFNGTDNPAFCKSDGTTVCPFLHSSNYTTYTVKKDGTGASGTWGISINGNAKSSSTSSKLTTPRSIWGQSFDGTKDISGALSGVTNVNNTMAFTTAGNVLIGNPTDNGTLLQVNGIISIPTSSTNAKTGDGIRFISVTDGSTVANINSAASGAIGIYTKNDFGIMVHQSSIGTGTSEKKGFIIGPTGSVVYGDFGTTGYIVAQGVGQFGGILYANGGIDATGNVDVTGNVTAAKFIKINSSSNYVLLGNGDHKLESNLTVNSASKLTNTVQLWGQSFDGTKNISGNITGYNFGIMDRVSNPYVQLTDSNGTVYFQIVEGNAYMGSTSSKSLMVDGSGNVGIGITAPSYKLSVEGYAYTSGYIKAGSNNNYILLGGGGHKAISDFLLKSEVANQELSNNLTTITKSLTVTADWMDTGISSTNIPTTGTYIVQVSVHNSTDNIWYGYWSGVMSWYVATTNDTDTDEIILHRAGHAYGNTIYLRTVMQSNSVLKLQIAANKTLSTAATYTFKFKRVI